MTHDEILQAARERIAEIDKQTTALAAERAKLQAMLGETVDLTGTGVTGTLRFISDIRTLLSVPTVPIA
jgi:hypothetical protein